MKSQGLFWRKIIFSPVACEQALRRCSTLFGLTIYPRAKRWMMSVGAVAILLAGIILARRFRSAIAMVSLVRASAAEGSVTYSTGSRTPTFVGSKTCGDRAERDLWKGSHHQLAMQPANSPRVLGDFDDAISTNSGVSAR